MVSIRVFNTRVPQELCGDARPGATTPAERQAVRVRVLVGRRCWGRSDEILQRKPEFIHLPCRAGRAITVTAIAGAHDRDLVGSRQRNNERSPRLDRDHTGSRHIQLLVNGGAAVFVITILFSDQVQVFVFDDRKPSVGRCPLVPDHERRGNRARLHDEQVDHDQHLGPGWGMQRLHTRIVWGPLVGIVGWDQRRHAAVVVQCATHRFNRAPRSGVVGVQDVLGVGCPAHRRGDTTVYKVVLPFAVVTSSNRHYATTH